MAEVELVAKAATLYSAPRPIALHDAIALAAPLLGPATGLAYARQAAWFETVDPNGQRLGAQGHRPYEYRLFSERGELRWVCDLASEAGGDAVVLSEDEALVSKFGTPARLDVLKLKRKPLSEYILWGSAHSDAVNGWIEAGEDRVGTFRVPVAAALGQRLALQFVEYVVVEARHGNARVAEERLVGLRAITV